MGTLSQWRMVKKLAAFQHLWLASAAGTTD